jgi:hypothetical protein
MDKRASGVLGLLLALPAWSGSIDQFDWLSGHWCGRQGDERVEEMWTTPAGNAVLGVGQTLGNAGMQSFEYMRIEERNGKPHFVAQPGGAPPTAFALGAHEAQSATFHNPDNDFPQSVRYWRDGAALRAEISGPDGQGGLMTIGFEYKRCSGE